MSDEECKWLPGSWWRCKMAASDVIVMTPSQRKSQHKGIWL